MDGGDRRRGRRLDEIEIYLTVEIEEAVERGSEGFEGVEVGEVGLRESVTVSDRRFEKARPFPAQRYGRHIVQLRSHASHCLCNCKKQKKK